MEMEKKEREEVKIFILLNITIIIKTILFNLFCYNGLHINNGLEFIISKLDISLFISSFVFIFPRNIWMILALLGIDALCIAENNFFQNNFTFKASSLLSLHSIATILTSLIFIFIIRRNSIKTKNYKIFCISIIVSIILGIIDFCNIGNSDNNWSSTAKRNGLYNKLNYEEMYTSTETNSACHIPLYLATYSYYKHKSVDTQQDYIIGETKQLILNDQYTCNTINNSLPKINITTENLALPSYTIINSPVGLEGNTIIDNEYINCSLSIGDTGAIPSQIKIRGNGSAANYDKKSFRIKLETKENLIKKINPSNNKSDKDKDWILLAYPVKMNYLIAQKISELLSIEYQPQSEYVELFINNHYMGVYLLTQVIDKGKKNKIKLAEDGFIIEQNLYWWTEKSYFKSKNGFFYTYKCPKGNKIKDSEKKEIIDYINKCEESMEDGTFDQYIDIESFAKFCICHDIIGTHDFAGTNKYLCKYSLSDNSKLTIPVIWDIEHSMSNNTKNGVAEVLLRNFSHNQAFIETYKRIFSEVKTQIIPAIEEAMNTLDSAQMNRAYHNENDRWKSSITDFESQKKQNINFIKKQIELIEKDF